MDGIKSEVNGVLIIFNRVNPTQDEQEPHYLQILVSRDGQGNISHLHERFLTALEKAGIEKKISHIGLNGPYGKDYTIIQIKKGHEFIAKDALTASGFHLKPVI